MNQRQKKRASQGKKRYHEAAKRQDSHSKASSNLQRQADSRPAKSLVQNESTATPTPTPKTQGSNELHERVDSNEGQPRKSYSKRKITSNWSRYEEDGSVEESGYLHSSETEEELQQRLLQLFNLPTQTVASTATQEPEHNILKTRGPSNSFITLDCTSLAESLATIPVHERLGLNAELLEVGGYCADNQCVSQETEQRGSLVALRGVNVKQGSEHKGLKENISGEIQSASQTEPTTSKDTPNDVSDPAVSIGRAQGVESRATGADPQSDELDDMLDQLLA